MDYFVAHVIEAVPCVVAPLQPRYASLPVLLLEEYNDAVTTVMDSLLILLQVIQEEALVISNRMGKCTGCTMMYLKFLFSWMWRGY